MMRFAMRPVRPRRARAAKERAPCRVEQLAAVDEQRHPLEPGGEGDGGQHRRHLNHQAGPVAADLGTQHPHIEDQSADRCRGH